MRTRRATKTIKKRMRATFLGAHADLRITELGLKVFFLAAEDSEGNVSA